jgi:hypothetical protein
MALISCAECGRDISDKAAACPHCGHPVSTGIQPPRILKPSSPPAGDTAATGIGQRVKRAVAAAFAWFFGVLLVLAGLGLFLPPDSTPLAGLLLLLAGAVLLPSTARWARRKLGITVSPRVVGGSLVVLVVASGIAIAFDQERSATRSTAAADSARLGALRTQFDTASMAILERMRSAIGAADWQSAMRAAAPYRSLGDQRLDSLYSVAAELRQAEIDEAREKELLARVRRVPASDLSENRRLYGQLMNLNPDQPTYRERYDYYNGRISKREAEAAERRRRFGDAPQASAWDGTYGEVKDYLREVMNDPKSLEMDSCTGVYNTDEGWLVGCDYRGRNAFGGMVRQSNWFVIRRGVVVAMKEASAYRR